MTELPDSDIFGTENKDKFMQKAKMAIHTILEIGNPFTYNRVTLAISAVCRIRRVLSFEIPMFEMPMRVCAYSQVSILVYKYRNA